MHLKKVMFLPISLALSAAGCAGIGSNATYYMGTTSFHYDPSYNTYMVKLNGSEIGSGGMNTSAVKLGPQDINWEESNSKKQHQAKNQVTLTKDDLKGMKYLALHIYPDDTVEINTSNAWPSPKEKGMTWLEELKIKSKELKCLPRRL